MPNPDEKSIPVNAEASSEAVRGHRFDRFSEPERRLLSEALSELLQVKQEELEIVNADLGDDPANHFSEADSDIPAIERIIVELEV